MSAYTHDAALAAAGAEVASFQVELTHDDIGNSLDVKPSSGSSCLSPDGAAPPGPPVACRGVTYFRLRLSNTQPLVIDSSHGRKPSISDSSTSHLLGAGEAGGEAQRLLRRQAGASHMGVFSLLWGKWEAEAAVAAAATAATADRAAGLPPGWRAASAAEPSSAQVAAGRSPRPLSRRCCAATVPP